MVLLCDCFRMLADYLGAFFHNDLIDFLEGFDKIIKVFTAHAGEIRIFRYSFCSLCEFVAHVIVIESEDFDRLPKS